MIFDKYAARGAYHYDWYKSDPVYKKLIDKAIGFCQGSTLDIGCGEGLLVDLLAQKKQLVIGLDNSPEAIKIAKPGLNIQLCDIEEEDLVGNLDYMACINVIEHLRRPQRIVEIFQKNIAKAGIIITDFPQDQLSSYHVQEFTPQELKKLFKAFKTKSFEIDDFHGIEVYK